MLVLWVWEHQAAVQHCMPGPQRGGHRRAETRIINMFCSRTANPTSLLYRAWILRLKPPRVDLRPRLCGWTTKRGRISSGLCRESDRATSHQCHSKVVVILGFQSSSQLQAPQLQAPLNCKRCSVRFRQVSSVRSLASKMSEP